jgi:hypothetical protein
MLFTGVSLIAGITSIVGGIGLVAGDCHDRESGGQRCPPRSVSPPPWFFRQPTEGVVPP